MLDPKIIRSDAQAIAEALKKKKFELDVNRLADLDSRRKILQTATEGLQNERNLRSKSIGKAKAAGEDVSEILSSMDSMKTDLEEKKEQLNLLQKELNDYLLTVPNVPSNSVPAGVDENDNQEISKWGTPKSFDFEVKDHTELGEALEQGLDFEERNQNYRFALRRDDWQNSATTPCTDSIHARYSYSRAWLYRSERALFSQCGLFVRYWAVAEV